jgi:Mg2+-importing ATPase
MLYVGPISSIFDFVTFYVLIRFFQAGQAFFHTGWFVESLATQTLVIYVIRTIGNPLRSKPSRPLLITTLLVVAVGMLLPFTALAGPLGFVPLTGAFYLFVIVATLLYLMSVQLAKGLLFKSSRSGGGSSPRGAFPRDGSGQADA